MQGPTMAVDPLATQRDLTTRIAAELADAGFEAMHEIGHGGFGVVYRCRQPSLDRMVAIKVLTADLETDNLERFLREQRAMGKLSGHPHIVSIFDVGATDSGRPYLVMQYHPRGSLDAHIHQSGPVDWESATHVGVMVAGALETAHRHGMLHRDVKPGNILLTDYGEPQLTDFGIARIAGGFETTTGAVTGSPAFTAPEVLQGDAPNPAADVYGLGATLFCAITGHAVFERHSGEEVVAQFLRIARHPIPDLRAEGIPADVCEVLEHAMSRDPANRPPTAADLGELLRDLQGDHGLAVDEMPVPISAGTMPPVPGTAQHSGPQQGVPRPRLTPTYVRTAAWRSSTAAITPPAAATRFSPPERSGQLVPRLRLLDQLRAGQRRRLVVIHAPTGFGKSALAAQWADALAAEGVAVAWLTVDHDDNTVVWFLAHLIEAIRVVRPDLARELGAALEEHGDDAERYVLTSLINEIHERGEQVAVVIDDWNKVSSADTRSALAFLLENGCHHAHIVVASRTQSGLPLSRMRVHDELVEIDSTALRFDRGESRRFLVDLAGLDLDRSDVDELTESTGGWAAALQLASLSLRDCDDPTLLIAHLSGRHHAIGEFLTENVLASLDPAMLDFLLATSVTQRICGELASALSGVSRGQEMLAEVEERDLFLRRVDDEGQWFAYQPLFADFLRQRLQRDRPEKIPELHRTACEWFAAHHMLSDAVDHALAADDQRRAVELVEDGGIYLIDHSQVTTLIGLVGKLPPRLVVGRPRLQLSLAWANILLHHTDAARQALTLLDAALERSELGESEIAELRVDAAVVEAVVESRADHTDLIDELVTPALARPDALPPWVVSTAANIATFTASTRGDFAEAHRLQEWALPYHERNTGPYILVHGQCWLGLAEMEQLEFDAAEDRVRKAVRTARRTAGRHSLAARLTGSVLGELSYQRGELDEAERLLDEGYTLGGGPGPVDFKLARYALGARIKVLRGDPAEASIRLNEGMRVAEAMSLSRLRATVENERIRLGLDLEADLTGPPPVQYAQRRRPVAGIDAIIAQIEEDTGIRLLHGRDPELACLWAQEWVDRHAGTERRYSLLLAQRLSVGCLAAAEHVDDAKALLAEIAARCAALRLPRFLPDGGPRLATLLAALHADQREGHWRPEWAAVPAAFLQAATAAAVPHTL